MEDAGSSQSQVPLIDPSITEWPPLGVPRRVSTGCNQIDNVIGGGFEIGKVTEICGESGLGKTHLCMQSILADKNNLTHRGYPTMAIYITAGCTFLGERYQKLGRRYHDEGDDSALADLLIVKADAPNELSEQLTQVKRFLESQETTPKKTRVIVLDSISALFSYASRSKAELEEQTNMVTSFGFALQRIAHQFNLAILVCNTVVNSWDPYYQNNFTTSGRVVKPAVGKAWDKKLASRVVLTWEMNESGTAWERNLFQTKGADAGPAKCKYEIKESGIEPIN